MSQTTESPAFATAAELFSYIKPLPWRTLRIYRWNGLWFASASTLSNNLIAKA